jgi:hypothetical protein
LTLDVRVFARGFRDDGAMLERPADERVDRALLAAQPEQHALSVARSADDAGPLHGLQMARGARLGEPDVEREVAGAAHGFDEAQYDAKARRVAEARQKMSGPGR